MFAEVAFPISNFKTFTYLIPNTLKNKIQVGSRVVIFFGKKKSQGIVVSLTKNSLFNGKIKPIDSLVDDVQVVTPELWKLILWMSAYYITPIGQVAKTVLPTKLSTNYSPSKSWYVSTIKTYDSTILIGLKKRAPKQYKIFKILDSKNMEVKVSDLKGEVSNPLNICRELAKNKLVELSERVSFLGNTDYIFNTNDKKIIFNDYQKNASNILKKALKTKKYSPFLLHGVTGSGKTEIFIDLVRRCITNGKTAIILLPEISLTPQIAGRFKAVFGDLIALWHSKLNQAQRSWTWKEICKGTFKVIIGARSAVFLPMKNLGLIIIDEEQEGSFQQESPAPRYHARNVALIRAKENNSIALLASATPSLESYYNYLNKKLQYIYLPNRYGGAEYPDIHLVDMNKEQDETGKYGMIFSSILQDKIEHRLIKNEQIILLQNRRGYSPVVVCNQCGNILMCPHCKVTISFHLKNNCHLCHFCGFYEPKEGKKCSDCNSTDINYRGTGTQKVETVIKEIFPNASVARLDIDTSSSGKNINSTLKSFNNGDIDILLGTQMIAKGLDFPNTTLVGIINADLGLHLPDFRASEKIFQLLYQASGRSGRGKKKGEVVIQTYSHNNSVIKSASKLDMKEFYSKILEERKELNYPPYSWLAKIEIIGTVQSKVFDLALSISNFIENSYEGLHVLGPAPCYLEKLKGQYRYQIIFKSEKLSDPNGKNLHQYIDNILSNCRNRLNFKGNKVNIHMDPMSLI